MFIYFTNYQIQRIYTVNIFTIINCYWLDYNALKKVQQILVSVHLLHLDLYQHLFLYCLIVSSFLEITVLVCSLFLLWKQFFDVIWINLYGSIFSQCFVFYNDKFKVILGVRNWIKTIRQIKFVIPSESRYFKLIFVIHWFNVFPRVINT